MRWDVPRLAVDAVLLHKRKLVLVRRGREPFRGRYALPGGFVEYGERLEDALEREVFEETGLQAEVREFLGVYAEPGRDPRGHVVSVAFVAESLGGSPSAGTDAAATRLVPLSRVPRLAFDHNRIVDDYRKRRRARPRRKRT